MSKILLFILKSTICQINFPFNISLNIQIPLFLTTLLDIWQCCVFFKVANKTEPKKIGQVFFDLFEFSLTHYFLKDFNDETKQCIGRIVML